MKKLPIEQFEKLLMKSNIDHKVKANHVGITNVDLDVLGLHVYVSNASVLNDGQLERLMVHVGYPKPAELMALIRVFEKIEILCAALGFTFEELASEEFENREEI